MDRRKFIKLVGGTTTAPLIPFRVQMPNRRRTDQAGPRPPDYISRILLNGIDYTHACSQIEGRSEAIEITTLEDMPGRRFIPGQPYLRITLLTATAFQAGDRIAIAIHFPNGEKTETTGIVTNCVFEANPPNMIETVLTIGLEGGYDADLRLPG